MKATSETYIKIVKYKYIYIYIAQNIVFSIIVIHYTLKLI